MSEAGTFGLLEGHRYMRLTTFRKNGEAVPTTVWFALVDGKAYVFTSANSGKAKRIHNNPRVTLTPSNFRGKSPQRKASSRQEPASWTRAKRRCPTGP